MLVMVALMVFAFLPPLLLVNAATSRTTPTTVKSGAGVLAPLKVPVGAKAATKVTVKSTASPTVTPVGIPTETAIRAEFAQFQAKHQKKYANAAETETRYATFKRRMLAVYAANAAVAAKAKVAHPSVSPHAVFSSLSPLADLDDQQFKKKLGGKPNLSTRKVPIWRTPVRPTKTAVLTKATSVKAVAVPATKKAIPIAKKSRFSQHQSDVTPTSSATPPVKTITTSASGAILIRGPNDGEGGYKGKKGGQGVKSVSDAFDPKDTRGMGGDWYPPWGKEYGLLPNGQPIPQLSPWESAHKMVFDLSFRFPSVVRDQDECQACWAIASVEHFQAELAANSPYGFSTDPVVKDAQHKHRRLSVQQLIDCNVGNTDRHGGCSGGSVTDAWDYIMQTGVRSAYVYPVAFFWSETGVCRPIDRSYWTNVQTDDNTNLFKAQSEFLLLDPCLSGACVDQAAQEDKLVDFWKNPGFTVNGVVMNPRPVVAYVDASNWLSYSGGIFPADRCSSTGEGLTHIIQIVGRGTDGKTGEEFWLIRNSWGSDWGEQGYIRLPVGKNACGLFNYVTFLTYCGDENNQHCGGWVAPKPPVSLEW